MMLKIVIPGGHSCIIYSLKSGWAWVLRGWGEREGSEWVVREGVEAGGRNDPNLV
jgi:hypothetical protein